MLTIRVQIKVLLVPQSSLKALLGVGFPVVVIRLACAIKFSETKLKPGIVSGFVALKRQITLYCSPSESWEQILRPYDFFSFTGPHLICKSHLTAVALWPTGSLLSTTWQWKQTRCWACRELQTLLILDNMRNTNPSPFPHFPHHSEMYFGSVCWSSSFPLPFSTSPKTSLPSHFFSPLQPASFKSTIELCPPCPKVMPLSSICPLKSSSPSPPKSIFPTFPLPSYFKMLKLVGMVPFTILAQCSTTRKSYS